MSRHSPTERIILGHKAWRRAARLLQVRCQRLQHRLDNQDQTPGRILAAEVERLRAAIERLNRVTHRRRRRDLDKHLRDRDTIAQARTWAARWKAVAHRYRNRSRQAGQHNAYSLLCRVQAENEVACLQNALDSALDSANRIQADGNALAEQLHAWRQACIDHGIAATPEALRETLHMVGAILSRHEARGIVVEANL
jgi:hypothetical protein